MLFLVLCCAVLLVPRLLVQYMPLTSAAHEGYALVPPVLQELSNLQHLKLNISSGQSVDLTCAAATPDIDLVLTLAHYEQTPFNR